MRLEGTIATRHDEDVAAIAPDKPAPSPAILTCLCVGAGRKEWTFTEDQARAWAEAYPALDVLAEVRKALTWLCANETRRKTARGMPRFLVAWLNRATDYSKAGARVQPWPRRGSQDIGSSAFQSREDWTCPHVEEHGSRATCQTACHLGRPRKDGQPVRRWTEADAREGFTGLVP